MLAARSRRSDGSLRRWLSFLPGHRIFLKFFWELVSPLNKNGIGITVNPPTQNGFASPIVFLSSSVVLPTLTSGETTPAPQASGAPGGASASPKEAKCGASS